MPTLWAEAHDIIWIEHSPLSSTSYEDTVLGFYSNSAKNESCFPFKNNFVNFTLLLLLLLFDKPLLKKKKKTKQNKRDRSMLYEPLVSWGKAYDFTFTPAQQRLQSMY